MRSWTVTWPWLAAWLAGCGAPASDPVDAGPTWECPGPPLRGISVSHVDGAAAVAALGAGSVHFWIHWDDVQPELSQPLADLDQVTDPLVQAFADGALAGVDWTAVDAELAEYGDFAMVPGVGSGYLNDMPALQGERITPDTLGTEAYLANLTLYVRACARRYRGRVAGWQVENELNVARIGVLTGLRGGDAWADPGFRDRLVEELAAAVHAEDPGAWVTSNLHSEVNWEADAARWADFLDWIGLDAYPNYLAPEPLRVADIADRVSRARSLGGGKPVVIMETGFPSGPAADGFTEDLQAAYFGAVYPDTEAAGSCGLFYFKMTTPEEAGDEFPPQENFWGVTRSDGAPKAVWHVLHALFT